MKEDPDDDGMAGAESGDDAAFWFGFMMGVGITLAGLASGALLILLFVVRRA